MVFARPRFSKRWITLEIEVDEKLSPNCLWTRKTYFSCEKTSSPSFEEFSVLLCFCRIVLSPAMSLSLSEDDEREHFCYIAPRKCSPSLSAVLTLSPSSSVDHMPANGETNSETSLSSVIAPQKCSLLSICRSDIFPFLICLPDACRRRT